MPIKNNLKDFRSKFNINQQEFGACIGVSRQTISIIERGNAMSSNFQKDWYNSCDEGQRKLIGEVCYKSFILTNSIYTFLFIILVIVAPILKLGSFSILLFGFVNILNLSVYCFTAYKIEHRKK